MKKEITKPVANEVVRSSINALDQIDNDDEAPKRAPSGMS